MLKIFFVCAIALVSSTVVRAQSSPRTIESITRGLFEALRNDDPTAFAAYYADTAVLRLLVSEMLLKEEGLNPGNYTNMHRFYQSFGDVLGFVHFMQARQKLTRAGLQPRNLRWVRTDTSGGSSDNYGMSKSFSTLGMRTTNAFVFFNANDTMYAVSLENMLAVGDRWHPGVERGFRSVRKAATVEEFIKTEVSYDSAMVYTDSLETVIESGIVLKNYTGTLGKQPITLSVKEWKEEETPYQAYYFQTSVDAEQSIDLKISVDGQQWLLAEKPFTGYFRLTQNANGFTGTWHSPDGKKTLPVKLTLQK